MTDGKTADEDCEKDRNFVTALARGLDVLRCFRPNETELTNNDIAVRTGLPKPTVSRLTHTLCKLDYLAVEPRTGAYRLGAGVIELGFGVLSGIGIGQRANDVLRELNQGPNSYITAALGERFQDKVIYVSVNQSVQDVSLTANVGARLPLFFSAIGRAILVVLSEEKRTALFEAARIKDPTLEAARRKSFETAQREYQSRGYCTGYGDWRKDVNGIAVPVLSLNSSRIFGLNVGGPSFYVSIEELERDYAAPLIAAGRALSLHR